jgi:hypothetical protein
MDEVNPHSPSLPATIPMLMLTFALSRRNESALVCRLCQVHVARLTDHRFPAPHCMAHFEREAKSCASQACEPRHGRRVRDRNLGHRLRYDFFPLTPLHPPLTRLIQPTLTPRPRLSASIWPPFSRTSKPYLLARIYPRSHLTPPFQRASQPDVRD